MNTNNTNTEKANELTVLVTAIKALFAFLAVSEKEFFNVFFAVIQGFYEGTKEMLQTICLISKQIVCKILETVVIMFGLNIILIFSIVLAEHSNHPLARAWLETLKIIAEAALKELAIIIVLFL
jgi:hypothetical protein